MINYGSTIKTDFNYTGSVRIWNIYLVRFPSQLENMSLKRNVQSTYMLL